MPDQPLTIRARRDDPNSPMVLQQEIDELKDQHDDLFDRAGTGGGAAGPGNTYVFTQSSPSATWTVTHNLSCFPSVTVVDTGGSEIIPHLVYTSNMVVTLTFGSAISGKAYLN